MAVRRISIEERRARLARRHRLAGPGSASSGRQRADGDVAEVADVVDGLIGLHATDPATVFLSARARTSGLAPVDLERTLYEERGLVRMLGMRRTMWVVARSDVPMVQSAVTDAIAVRERRLLLKELETADLAGADPEQWLRGLEGQVRAVLAERGELTGAELGRAVPELRTRVSYAPGKSYGGEVTITNRVLNRMSMQGAIIRGRPESWNGSRYRWALRDRWLPDEQPVPTDEAQVALVRRWLAGFGPGTVEDLKWWTGLSVTAIRSALQKAGVVAVELEEAAGYLLESDQEPEEPVDPWVALLPALDSTVMGWRHRDWYLGPHADALFDRNGNAGPTVWADGRIVGGWAQRANGEVVYRLLDDVGKEHRQRIDDEAGGLAAWLGDVRVIPRFRTPLEMELAG